MCIFSKICDDYEKSRVYLPVAEDEGLSQDEGIKRYMETEFPESETGDSIVFSVPRMFTDKIEQQASRAEQIVFLKLANLANATRVKGLWVLFFHGICYAGHSNRNQRFGKLMIREHDFVAFVKYKGRFYVIFMEVKSSQDSSTSNPFAPITSDARMIKNNKRSAQHQLRDHLEVLRNYGFTDGIQSYIMWPFLGSTTKDPRQKIVKRWQEDGKLHVFEDNFKSQENFEEWFYCNVINGINISEKEFQSILNRFIILSCGVFVDEIHKGMLALLTQEQLVLLTTDNSTVPRKCGKKNNGPLIVHGAAGTGKTLLVLKKLQLLHEQGQLNEKNRALYICYWPGIRCDFENKLKILGINQYVDTSRFYISLSDFLFRNKSKYKHIFMDEAEAICLAFKEEIVVKTMSEIYQRYHDGNCEIPNCTMGKNFYRTAEECNELFENHEINSWGQLWFLVDINQASLFLPKHSPAVLKFPKIELNRVMRSTGFIFNVFKQFYANPIPFIQQRLPINMGHKILGPPIFWVDINSIKNHNQTCNQTLHTLVCVIIDLCATKGIKANNICVLPFFINENLTPENLNGEIAQHFVENGYKPQAVGDVEKFVTNAALNDFLIAWALRVKGLEFKVVILVLDEDDFNINDSEDRKRMYIMASRCTCLLIVICPKDTKQCIDVNNSIVNYSFGLKF